MYVEQRDRFESFHEVFIFNCDNLNAMTQRFLYF